MNMMNPDRALYIENAFKHFIFYKIQVHKIKTNYTLHFEKRTILFFILSFLFIKKKNKSNKISNVNKILLFFFCFFFIVEQKMKQKLNDCFVFFER